MKALRYLSILFSLFFILILQGCGDDTGGALTMTDPPTPVFYGVVNGVSFYKVSTTVKYVPPSGKSVQGVVVTVKIYDLSGLLSSEDFTLSSESSSFAYSYPVRQYSITANPVRIEASIGSMTASVGTTIPSSAPLTVANPNVDFATGTLVNATANVAYTGGAGTVVVESTDANIGASITADGIVTITLLNANVTGSTTVHLTDDGGADVSINVTYTD